MKPAHSYTAVSHPAEVTAAKLDLRPFKRPVVEDAGKDCGPPGACSLQHPPRIAAVFSGLWNPLHLNKEIFCPESSFWAD